MSIRIRSIGSAWFAFTVMTTALDSDERLHSDVGLKQERERTTQRMYIRTRREKTLRSGERLQRRTQRKRQLRTVESADDRLEEKTTLASAENRRS